jgi:CDP-diacylglycerol pyrophosphatase
MAAPSNALNFLQTAALLGVSLVCATQNSLSAENRELLWQVIQACRANYDMTGAAFPCLDVNVSAGVERGYVILRRPIGNDDLILAATRKIVGIEDPSLRGKDAANYFEDAWNARTILTTRTGGPPAPENVALAVNSSLTRRQDQLHIHIGCLSPQAKRSLQASKSELSQTGWHHLTRSVGGLMFWALRIDQETLEGVNPFRLALEGLAVEARDMEKVTIVVIGNRSIEGRGAFILLATTNDPFRSGFRSAGSNLLANICQS